MFRRITAIVFCSVLMLLAFPVCCLASGAESFGESSSKAAVMSTSDSSKSEKDKKEKNDSSWMIYLSIGAGIVIVAVTIGVIASRDA